VTRVVTVPYTFQLGGDQMLAVSGPLDPATRADPV
jgi:hypothetical protein